VGTLYPRGLVAGPGHAFLDASLMPTGRTRGRLALPSPPISDSARHAHANAVRDLAKAIVSTVALTDDRGKTYDLRVEDIQHYPGPRQERGPVSLRLGVNPVPAREVGWLELRGQNGAVTRLMSSADPHVRVSRQAVSDSPAARELSQQAQH